jgi:hypothetical protein
MNTALAVALLVMTLQNQLANRLSTCPKRANN